jgi:hypothetical protein
MPGCGDLPEQITKARKHLREARIVGAAEAEFFWQEKLDELLDQLPRQVADRSAP